MPPVGVPLRRLAALPSPVGAMAAIAVGGALGTLARYGTDRALVSDPLGFPWATFAVNVTGSFLLGVVVTLVVERWPPTRYVRPFAAIGFCGGFTTFSTLAVETTQRIQHGQVGLAAGLRGGLAGGRPPGRPGRDDPGPGPAACPCPRDRPVPDPDDLRPADRPRRRIRRGPRRDRARRDGGRRRAARSSGTWWTMSSSGGPGREFPFGTLVINVTGSFVLGLLTGSALHHGVSATWLTVVGTGLIGAYTTFSTFTFDTVRLAEADGGVRPLLNVAASSAVGARPGPGRRRWAVPASGIWPAWDRPDGTRTRLTWGDGRCPATFTK